jgi:hypothetical protein
MMKRKKLEEQINNCNVKINKIMEDIKQEQSPEIVVKMASVLTGLLAERDAFRFALKSN